MTTCAGCIPEPSGECEFASTCLFKHAKCSDAWCKNCEHWKTVRGVDLPDFWKDDDGTDWRDYWLNPGTEGALKL